MFRKEFSAPGRRGPERASHAGRDGRCIALVDARFLAWLIDQSGGQSGATLRRRAVLPVLSAALAQAGLELDLRRAYWYTDKPEAGWVDDQVTRGVLSDEVDGGVSLQRAIGSDLERLAQRRAVDHLLLVSDDERLLGAVDEAQLCGVSVHLLVDERGIDPARVGREDPGWATLLAQADRRIPLAGALLADLVQERTASLDTEPAATDPVAFRADVEALVQAWWNEEPEAQRDDLRDELRHSRGIPAEVDRVLLLRSRRTFGRALSWSEKKLLREIARATALGEPPASAADDPGADPAPHPEQVG